MKHKNPINQHAENDKDGRNSYEGVLYRKRKQFRDHLPHSVTEYHWALLAYILFVICIALSCFLEVYLTFSLLNSLLALYVLPVCNAWNLQVSLWAATHGPSIVTDLVPFGVELFIVLFLALRWIVGFMIAFLVTRGVYVSVIRHLKSGTLE